MKWGMLLKVAGMVLGTVIAGLVAASLFDIVIAVFNIRFYTEVAFVVTFVVAGIFTASIAYINIAESPAYKSPLTHYTVLGVLFVCGVLFFFLLANLEGGEYEVAFKGYGASLFISSFLFIRRDKAEKKKAR